MKPDAVCSWKGMPMMVLFFLFSVRSLAQFSFTEEIRFIQYLQNKDLYREAQYSLDQINTHGLSVLQRDSIYYFSGWGAYSTKQLEIAVRHLLQVSPSFPLYKKSRLFAGYCLAYQSKTDSSTAILSALSLADTIDREMQQFQLAGIKLLERDYEAYEAYSQQFTYAVYALQKEETNFNTYYNHLRAHRRKSPLLAGVYSTLLPGAGKFYAGKRRQGLAAFLPVLSLALITAEAYRKGGLNVRSIGFGSLFSVFYIGNIWGSVLSVKIKEKEFYKEYDNKILFDLHIPLRNLYN